MHVHITILVHLSRVLCKVINPAYSGTEAK
jgi:hypothetical protein